MKKIIAICSSILLLISPLQSLGYVSLESVATNGTISNGSSDSLSMTPDGRYIVFTNTGDTLVPGDGDAFNDIFLRDTLSQITTKISI
ncbi:hypothetical protein KA478_00905 [Patescibacteria group bacterium]|nr:hypothetical protein [Patescibacteria group bacterium]